MKLINPLEMSTHLRMIGRNRARLLGLDVGSDCVGSAISVNNLQGAEPLRTLIRDKKNFVPELRQLVSEYKISGFIIGFPTYKLKATTSATKISKFVSSLTNTGKFHGIRACYWDEFATTRNVNLMLDQLKPEDGEDKGGKVFTPQDRKDITDKLAAVGILQGYLDYFNSPGAKPWKGVM